MSIVRRAFALAILVAAGSALAQGAAPGERVPAAGDPAGEAVPDDQAWGDEWFDEQAKKAAADEERRILEAAKAHKPAAPAPAPAAAPAPPAPTGPLTGLPPPAPDAPASAPAPVPESTARPIQLPQHHFADLQELWEARRAAQGQPALVEAQTGKISDALTDLDVAEVHAFAAAAARESRQLEAGHPAESVKRAELAIELGPSLPAAHVQLARARFAVDPVDVQGWGAAGMGALRATLGQPRYLRPLLFDLFGALAAGLLAAGAVVLLLAFARHARSFFHDVHHLFPRGTSPAQSAILAALVLALPLLFWVGPLAAAAVLAGSTWLYMRLAERVVTAGFVALLGLVPQLGTALAERAAWDGTPAARLYAVEQAGDFSELPDLESWVQREDAPPQAIFALARAHKREGDLDGARALYERVLRSRASWPAALVNLGNVRFLQGDMPAAERLYKEAVTADPALAEAYFDLSRLYYRRLDLATGQDTRARALELDRRLVARYAAGEEPRPRANRLLVDVPLSGAEMARLASGGPEAAALGTQLSRALVGPLPGSLALGAPLAVLALFGLLLAMQRRIHPSPTCTKCGRAVCIRCDPETRGGELCGQCLNVFVRKSSVDPLARVQKEIAVRRFQSRRGALLRVTSFVLAAHVLKGRTWRGLALLACAFVLAAFALQGPGLVRAPYGGFPEAWKLALIAPALVLLYAWSVRDGLRNEED